MPPKITDSRPASDAVIEMEEQTASGARRIVATYAEDFHDGVTLMSMLGVEPKGFVYKRYNEQREQELAESGDDASEETTAKKSTKKASKKKATKKAAKKTTKKATKKATKKTTKKATKKAAKKSSTTED
ncbi:hypothetical protein CGLAU_10590 [Corynebacterium glaucum]|uniref:Uncharacterized protein n=1 Tax=Corynebacterium glaucum TaxID=187491 RepID=A0A1Q2HYX7_9CORY|nr:histone [Corynebacterium glaucum]AQQ16052.1 hypothetical protein CGLAU_10590 [Corynebacterium glaucum]